MTLRSSLLAVVTRPSWEDSDGIAEVGSTGEAPGLEARMWS